MSTTTTEIERKFLVRDLPESLDQYPLERIRQGYLAITEGAEARIRAQSDRYFLTAKSGQGMTRAEVELPLSARTFASLWPLTRGKRVRKRRYRVPHHDLVIEVDIYRRKLKGLVTAEIEFASEQAARDFQPPEWLGEEITDNKQFSNQHLALHGLPTPVGVGDAGQ